MTPMPGWQPPSLLQAQYTALIAAIGSGAKVIRFQDRTVEYNSTDEMIKAANWLYLQLAASGGLPPGVPGSGGGGVKRQIRVYTEKGL